MEATEHEKEKGRRAQRILWVTAGLFVLTPLVVYYFLR